MKRILLGALAALALFYGGDWLALNFRSPRTSQLVIQQYYAVRLKGTAVEYMPLDPARENCTHSLFPQMGDPPCWYLTRHRVHEIDIGKTKASWWEY